MQVYEFSNYREFLRSVLADRINRKSGYSLRAMARDCRLASSTLSEVMNGKANLSIRTAQKIAKALKIQRKETIYLCDLVELESEKDPIRREEIVTRLQRANPSKRKISDLSVECFKQIADWYHSAILELSLLKNFDLTVESVAKKLKISKPAAQNALDRLEKLELLKRGDDGHLKRDDHEIRFNVQNKNGAMRQFYRQMFDRASRALDSQTPQERLSGFLNLPISPKALPEVDEAITKFFEEIRNIATRYGEETDVYHLMIHFINLTEKGDDQ